MAQPVKRVRRNSTAMTQSSLLKSLIENDAILVERNFTPPDYWGNAKAQIAERQWGKLTSNSSKAAPLVVFEFYAHLWSILSKGGDPNTVPLRRRMVSITPETINTFYELPAVVCEYKRLQTAGPAYWEETVLKALTIEGTTWERAKRPPHQVLTIPQNAINVYAKAWMRFINGAILPSSNESKISADRALLLYCICAGKPIDIGMVISDNIKNVAKFTKSGAPAHGSLITELCRNAGIQISNTDGNRGPLLHHLNELELRQIYSWPGGEASPDGLGYSEYFANVKKPKQPVQRKRDRTKLAIFELPPTSEQGGAQEEEDEDDEEYEPSSDNAGASSQPSVSPTEFAELREQFNAEVTEAREFRSEMRSSIREMRAEMKSSIGNLSRQMQGLLKVTFENRGMMQEELLRQHSERMYQDRLNNLYQGLHRAAQQGPIDWTKAPPPPEYPHAILTPYHSYEWHYQQHLALLERRRAELQQGNTSAQAPGSSQQPSQGEGSSQQQQFPHPMFYIDLLTGRPRPPPSNQ